MRIYLAARYSRREELNGYADELRNEGFTVDARWLLGEHKWNPLAAEVEAAEFSVPLVARRFALDDVEDLLKSDIVISFTEPTRAVSSSRGGRHVEFGLAYAWRKKLYLVGPRENVFHTLPGVLIYSRWDEGIKNDLREKLARRMVDRGFR